MSASISYSGVRTLPRTKFVACTLGILPVLLFTSIAVQGQSVNIGDDVARPIPGVGHDYIKGLNETVNPANGSLSVKIDLPVPRARGITLPFALTYNSGDVYHFSSMMAGAGGFGNNSLTGAPLPNSRSEQGHGWSDTLPYTSISQSTFPIVDPTYGVVTYCSLNQSYNFYDPSGGSHMLGLSAIGSTYAGNQPPYEIVARCSGQHIGNNNSAPTYTASQFGGDDQIIGQLDALCTGSSAASAYDGCGAGSPALTVTDLAGTNYIFPAGVLSQFPGPGSALPKFLFPKTIEDRNGNEWQISQPGWPIGYSVQDSNGRSNAISTTYGGTQTNPSPGPVTYTVGNLSFQVAYTTSSVNFSAGYLQVYPIATTGFGCTVNFAPNQSGMSVINTITLPNSQSYSFEYDSAFGLLSKITYPDGGWVEYTWGLSDNNSTVATFDGSISQPGGAGALPYPSACNFQYQTPVIRTRSVGYSASSSAALTQTFSYQTNWASNGYQWTTKTTTVATTDNVTGKQTTTAYTYTPFNQWPLMNTAQGAFPLQMPVEYTVTVSDWNNSSKLLSQTHKTWNDPAQMASETDTVYTVSGSLSKNMTYSYSGATSIATTPGFPGSLTNQTEYDFGGNKYRSTNYSYYSIVSPCLFVNTSGSANCQISQFPMASSHRPVAPCQIITYDGNSNRVAETDGYYDNSSTLCAGQSPGTVTSVSGLPINTHDETNYSTIPPSTQFAPYITRGDLTKTHSLGKCRTNCLTYSNE